MNDSESNIRPDYRASVEAGLRRLESEKLSFLSESRVVSKYDPENLSLYAPPAEDGNSEIETGVKGAYRHDTESLVVRNYLPGTETDFRRLTETEGVGDAVQDFNPEGSRIRTVEMRPNAANMSADEDAVELPTTTLQFVSGDSDDEGRTSCDSMLPEEPDYLLASFDPTDDVGRIAEELRLETVETVDVGRQAELVRSVLSAGLLAEQKSATSTVPKAQILRPANSRPLEREKAPDSAMDKLKQQGLFNPLPSHAEVSNSIQSLQNINDVLPPSDVRAWNGQFGENSDSDILDETIRRDPDDDDDEGFQNVLRLARAVQMYCPDPQILPTSQADNPEMDGRETIPIDIADIPMSAYQTPKAEHVKSAHEVALDQPTYVIKESNRKYVAWWCFFVFVLICGIGYLLYIMGALAWIHPMMDPYRPIEATVTSASGEPELIFAEEIRAAVDEASQKVDEAVQLEKWLPEWIETQINQQTSPEGCIPYIEMALAVFPDHPDYTRKLLELSMDAGQFGSARQIWKTIPETIRNNSEMNSLRYRMFAEDPHFLPPIAKLNENETFCDEIAPLGGGSTLTFKLRLNGENVGAFKPLQKRKQSNYRAEIAAWRLCELLECDFSIPWNRPIRIEHSEFMRLYDRTKSSKKSAYRKEFSDLEWTKEDGQTWLYGTLKDWVPDFTRFPIEMKSLWQPWLSQNNYIEEYKPLAEALSPLAKNQYTQKLLPVILGQSPELTTKQLAAQISEVLVFDFLVGNWDRFSGVPSWWGVNSQFKDGRIVSIDNGAAFPSYSNDKVFERYMMTERFSAHFIEALQNLDKDQTLKLLFPDATEREIKCFEQFWKQREAVLTRIKQLSEKYDKDKVLSL